MTEKEKVRRELFEIRTIETAELDHKIFALRRSVNLNLRVNNTERANRLLDEIGALEKEKLNLKKPGGNT